MTKFMKFLVLVLCLCTMLSLVACDPAGNPDEDKLAELGKVTEEEWNAAISEEKFDNVTFAFVASLTSPHAVVDNVVCKIDGDKGWYSETEEDWHHEEYADEEILAALKSIYMNTTLAILENFNDFTYDSATGTYSAKKDIVYNVTVMEYAATITASNVKVKLDADKLVAEISCDMKQEYTSENENGTIILNIIFNFYDYGKTVVTLPEN